MENFYHITSTLMPALVGALFVASYFLADKHYFFEFLAYFPRKREKNVKIGPLIFGGAFLLIALFNWWRFS